MIQMRNLQFKRMLMLLAGFLFLVGCVPEKKIGLQYLNQRRDMTMVIRAPKWVKMVNLSADSVLGGSELTQREKDSVNFYHSEILQNVKDTSLIGNYIRSLKKGFENQGYRTLITSGNDSVFPVKGNAFLINIGQVELDEQKYPIRDEVKYDQKLYAADYDLMKMALSFWIEVSKIENGVAVKPLHLLYDSFDKTEESSGYFDWNSKEKKMYYYSTVEKITPEFVALFSSLVGKNHALRLNEYLLNEYVAFFLPDKPDRILLDVNPKAGNLIRVFDPPFEEIHE